MSTALHLAESSSGLSLAIDSAQAHELMPLLYLAAVQDQKGRLGTTRDGL
jgi:hypothetical protein